MNDQGDIIAAMTNAVAEAIHALTMPEQRLVLWLVAKMECEDDALREYSMGVDEFAEILGPNSGDPYKEIDAACDRLYRRILKLKTAPQSSVTFKWFNHVNYFDDDLRIALQFHQNLKSILPQLRGMPLKAPADLN